MKPFPPGRGTNQLFKLIEHKEEEGWLPVGATVRIAGCQKVTARRGAVQGT